LCRIYNGLYGLVIPLAENNSGKEIGCNQTTKETIQVVGHVINQEALNNRLAGLMLNQQDSIRKQSIFIVNSELIYL
jgi:hypothetical protein